VTDGKSNVGVAEIVGDGVIVGVNVIVSVEVTVKVGVNDGAIVKVEVGTGVFVQAAAVAVMSLATCVATSRSDGPQAENSNTIIPNANQRFMKMLLKYRQLY